MPPHYLVSRRIAINPQSTSLLLKAIPPLGDDSPTSTEPLTPIPFGTSGPLEMSPVSRAAASAAQQVYSLAHTSATATSSDVTAVEGVWPDHLPDVPDVIFCSLAGGLGFGIVTAFCLVMIMFWPRRQHSRSAGKESSKGTYQAVAQGDVELEDLVSSCSSAVSCASVQPVEVSSAGEMLLRKRKRDVMKRTLRVDTTTEYRGLGIAVPGGQAIEGLLGEEKSGEEKPAEEDAKAPRGPGHGVSQAPAIHIHAPTKSTHEPPVALREGLDTYGKHTFDDSPAFKLRHHRSHHDLETGMLHDASHLRSSSTPSSFFARNRSGHATSDSRSSSTSSSSTSSAPISQAGSTLNLLLEKGENAIDFAATKLSKIMYDQVNRERDVEADLLLPVTAEERGRARSD
ncbi:hypothetical protein CERZMDRAFT_101225 [Cercospora zeae-maydis SCOH1-5]|uniref:Uncharacterized protein n=1 Tax=Cercospora zeae-maydis SCOH1-5 TaxID=717836 RepID=A0A6A6F3Z7_9PEZI|nr:hypothetical protein CERZMDRAFT_101225 [Cercospora zeae-maydis SCOH1-5]